MAMKLPLLDIKSYQTNCCRLKTRCYIQILKKQLGWKNQEPQIAIKFCFEVNLG
jgi:hypothetical protein